MIGLMIYFYFLILGYKKDDEMTLKNFYSFNYTNYINNWYFINKSHTRT